MNPGGVCLTVGLCWRTQHPPKNVFFLALPVALEELSALVWKILIWICLQTHKHNEIPCKNMINQHLFLSEPIPHLVWRNGWHSGKGITPPAHQRCQISFPGGTKHKKIQWLMRQSDEMLSAVKIRWLVPLAKHWVTFLDNSDFFFPPWRQLQLRVNSWVLESLLFYREITEPLL